MRLPGGMTCILGLVCLLLGAADVRCQLSNGIDPEALIERILAVDAEQRRGLTDVTFEAELVDGEFKREEFKEKVRFKKLVYLKFLTDTTLFQEKYLEYYKDGELQSASSCSKEARTREEKKRKWKARELSYPVLNPFQADHRALYSIEYRGVAEESVAGYACHRFVVTANLKSDTLINGEYFFDAESFRTVRVVFSPAELVKNLAFRLNKLDMTLTYGLTPDGYWLPRQFDIEGKGKVGFLFGVSFSGSEYYRNPVINSGLRAGLFEGTNDE